MKPIIFSFLLLSVVLAGCSKPSTEEQINQQITENVHALTAEERQAAQINGKSYFEKEWITADNQRGQLNNCRPSDSNKNGMVSCFGFVPKQGGGYAEKKVFCGYRPELVGCSDEDTVK